MFFLAFFKCLFQYRINITIYLDFDNSFISWVQESFNQKPRKRKGREIFFVSKNSPRDQIIIALRVYFPMTTFFSFIMTAYTSSHNGADYSVLFLSSCCLTRYYSKTLMVKASAIVVNGIFSASELEVRKVVQCS